MASTTDLGPVLVIGGCGFVGFHIVEALLKDPTCGPVSVISRNPKSNLCEGVSYHACDIANLVEARKLIAVVKPRIIFHAASPLATDSTVEPGEHYETSVEGTKNVLACAIETPMVKALVYTSTCAVAKGYPHFGIDEEAPLWEQDDRTIPYKKAKALADKIVREANCPLDDEVKAIPRVT